MINPESDVVYVEQYVPASPDVVFAFFADATKLSQWIGVSSVVEPRVGGRFRIAFTSVTVEGEVTAVHAPHTIAFTWGDADSVPIPRGSTRVTITLRAEGVGTWVRLEHAGLPAKYLADHDEGWTEYMPRLEAAVLGHPMGPDRS